MLISKFWKTGFFVLCAAASSQAPEFAQQYRQRLGGAVDELKVVMADFDQDALAAGLTRDEALSAMASSTDAFVRDRGQSMKRTSERLTRLIDQQQRYAALPHLVLPLHVVTRGDPTTVSGTWSIFKPAVPLTIAGFFYGLFGGGVGLVLSALPGRLFRRRQQDKSDQALKRALNEEMKKTGFEEGLGTDDDTDESTDLVSAHETEARYSDKVPISSVTDQRRNGPADPESSRG